LVRLRRCPAAAWAFKSFPELKQEEHIPTHLKMLKSVYPAQEAIIDLAEVNDDRK
jgi:hypothetical protein